MSFLPVVVSKEGLERGNGVMEAGRSACLLVGPGVGGWLVGVLTAPFALLADAVSFLVTAFLLSGVRAAEPAARGAGGRLREEAAEGVAFVVREPVLRRVAIGGALTRIGLGLCAVGHPLYLVVELGVDATRYGLLLFPAATALGAVAAVVFNVAQVSHRQRITPGHLLGRVNASMRFLMWGTTPLGGLAAGALGAWLGGHAVFVTGVAVVALSYLTVLIT